MKRLCVFAHWDRDNIIDDYVVYYLEGLKKVADTIIFVSDCDLSSAELEKIEGIADFSLAQKHGEYDFGSYKRGFLFAREHNLEFDELIFANDSCYGALQELEPIFNLMAKKKCDFWGMTKNYFGIKLKNEVQIITNEAHLQSYFLVFKKNVISSEVFENFIKSIKKENSKELVVINYEIKLTQSLIQAGFKDCAYINKYKHTENIALNRWKELILQHGFPLLKTSIPRHGLPIWGEVSDWADFIPENYPKNIIEMNVERLGKPYEREFDKMETKDKVLCLILKHFPFEIYLFAKLFDRKILSTFRRFFRYVFKKF